MKQLYPSGLVKSARATIKSGSLWKTTGTLLVLLIFLNQNTLAHTLVAELANSGARAWGYSSHVAEVGNGSIDDVENTREPVDVGAPRMASAVKNSETQITLTFDSNVATNGTNPTDFTVVDAFGTPFIVSAQVDGTAGDKDIILTVADLSTAQGDLKITYTNNNNELGSADTGLLFVDTDNTGVTLDGDSTAPTMVSALLLNSSTFQLTFSEPVQIAGANPEDFVVTDGGATTYTVTAITDGTAQDTEIIITADHTVSATGDLTITYINNNGEVSDFGSNALATDATGVTVTNIFSGACPAPNTFQLQHFGTGVAGLTPATLNTPVDANGTWAGNYVRVNVVSGNKYNFSLVGSEQRLIEQFGHVDYGFPAGAPFPNISFKRPQVDHDPMITLYDNTGSIGATDISGNVVGFNLDASPTETLPELDYTATYTGELLVAIDVQPGTVAYNPGSGPPNVEVAVAPADCSPLLQDSTSLRVTWIPSGPSLFSASKDSETQITAVFDTNVATNGGNPTDFTVTDGAGTDFPVSAQADGTAGDANIVLTVANLSSAIGDITVAYTNNNNEIVDTTDPTAFGANSSTVIDLDISLPTLESAEMVSTTEIKLTFSEPVQTNGGNPTDFNVTDAFGTDYAVSSQADGTAQDDMIVLTVADMSAALGNITVKYNNNNGEVSDFGGNQLATDGTGVEIDLESSFSPLSGKISWTFQGGPTGGDENGRFTTQQVTAGFDTLQFPDIGAGNRHGSIALGDLDDDGDLDFISGNRRGGAHYYENVGTTTVPRFGRRSIATLDTIRMGPGVNLNETRPVLEDIDNDGDLDLFFHSRYDYNDFKLFRDVQYFENIGSKTTPVFTYSTITGLESQNTGEFGGIDFGDLDNDGDKDMIVGGSDSLTYFKNIGSLTAPQFERQLNLDNPFDLIADFNKKFNEPSFLTPTPKFEDFDGDGDLDIYFVREDGLVAVIENFGTASVPNFVDGDDEIKGQILNGFGGDLGVIDVGTFGALDFGDINGDGVKDVILASFTPVEFFWLKGESNAPTLASATKDSDTQITLSLSEPVQTNGGNPTDFTVVDGLGINFVVSAQADGTVGDNDIVLTVANLSTAVGDLMVTYTNNNDEITSIASNASVNTNAVGVAIDTDATDPTLLSGTKDSDTQITVSFSEAVQTNGGNPTDFTVVDEIGTLYPVSVQGDGTAADDQIILTVANLSTALGDITISYANNNNEINDFGGNALATDATGVVIDSGLPAISYNKIFWATNDALLSSDLDGSNVETIPGIAAQYLRIDNNNKKIYYVKTDGDNGVYKADFDGSNIESVIVNSAIGGFELDLVNGKIYWAEFNNDKIRRANLDGSSIEDVIASAPVSPNSVGLDITNGKIYWALYNGSNNISRANLDGTSIEDVATGLNQPWEVELVNGKMYYSDRSKLRSAALDGSSPVDLSTRYNAQGIAVDAIDGKVYFGGSGIASVNLDGSDESLIVNSSTSGFVWSVGLAIVDKAPELSSAVKTSNTVITVTFSEAVQTNGTNPTDFSVVDGIGTNYPVSAQADGTAGDTDIVLTVADLSAAVGDLKVTYTNNNNEISDVSRKFAETDATGISIDTDATDPTLLSGAKDSDTQLTITFSEPVQIIGDDAGDWTVTDATSATFAVSQMTDGTANDAQLILTVADMSSATGPLTVTYTVDCSTIADFGGNALQTDATGIDIALATTITGVSVPSDDTYGSGATLDFTVTFSDPVTITGAPTLPITIGSTAVNATLNAPVTAATTAFFSYTVLADQEDTDGIGLGASLELNGATIQDAENVDAVLTLNGVGATTAVLVDGVAPAAPVFVSISDDNGSSNSDQITNDQSLFVRGTAEPNSQLSLSIDGEEVFGGGLIISVDGDGNWEFSPIGEGEFTIEEGQHTYTATVEDAGGNESPVSADFVVTVDLTAPAAPVVTGFSTDTGDSDTDNLTNDQTLMFTGTAEANGTVEVFIDASSIGTTSVDENGAWTYDHTATSLAEGTIAVTAKATDVAGNQGVASQAFDLEIDITAQAVPVVTGITTDTGASAMDNITNDQTLAFTGTAEANITVEVFMDASSIGTTTADANGNWVYDHTGTTLAEATYGLTAKSIDAAGNASAASASLSVEVDITPPNAGAVFIVINEVPEFIGEITNENRLVFSAISIDDDGFADFNDRALYENDTYELFINGESQGSTTAQVTVGATIDESSVSWNFDFTDEVIADGTYELTIVATDLAGNTTNGLEGYERPLIIDTQIPGAPVITGITSDTGSSDTDKLTNDQTLMFTGTAEANGTVEVFIDASSIGTTTVDENGDWTYDHTATTLSEGTISITAKAVDLAGNEGPLSDGTSVTIDITAYAVPVVTGITTDNGASATDNITNDQTLVFTGTAEANITVEVFMDASSIGTTTADANGDWMYDHTATTLAEATYSVTAKSIDAAGNASAASAALSVEVDITAPFSGTILQVQEDTDEGFDFITEDNTLIFVGVPVDGDNIAKEEDLALFENDTYEFFIDGASIGSVTGSYIEGRFGGWLLDHTNVVLADGSYQLSVVTTDLAGNTSPSVANFERTLIVDTQAPPTPTVDLVAASDLGISDTDDITSDISPTIEGTTERNATVTVFVDDSQVGTTTADDAGDWTFTIMTDWGDGTYVITAKAKDIAGNESDLSEGLSLTLDNGLDINDLEPADDEIDVLPNTDLIITFDKNVVKGTGNITIVQSDNDEVQQTIDVTSDLVFIDAETVIIDPADNILPPDTEFYVNIDAGAFQNEAGADFEGISDKTTWSFSIIAASVVSSVEVPANGGHAIGDVLDFTVSMVLPVTITGGTPTIPITIGEETVQATLVGTVSNSTEFTFRYIVAEDDLDADGITIGAAINLNGATMQDEFDVDALTSLNNVASTTQVFIDGVRPLPGLVLAVNTDSNIGDDLITFDNTVELLGVQVFINNSGELAAVNSESSAEEIALVEGDILEFFIDGASIGSAPVVEDQGFNVYAAVLDHTATALQDGSYTLSIIATDSLGNSTTSADLPAELSAAGFIRPLIIDTSAPVVSTIDLVADSDLGISDTDNLTADITPTVEGTTEANATVSIFVDDSQVGQATADDAGDWSFTIMTDWGDGTYMITAKANDTAGNESALSEGLSITLDNGLDINDLEPADDEVDVLPNTDLIITFDKNVVKGTGNITIVQSDNDEVQQTIDVTSDLVFIDAETVIIDPAANILPPDTEFYVNIDAGAFQNEAGADFEGISDKTTWTFSIIAASVVSSVAVPADGTYMIGDNLEFTVNMVLPVSVTGGTPSIPVTIGTETVNATLVGTATNTSTMVFRYTIAEGLEDLDGIAVGSAMNLNGSTMKDEFDVGAILTLNSVASTANVLVDAIKPAAPVVLSFTNDTGSATDDELTNDNTLIFTGTAEANATVNVSIDGSGIGTTRADGLGDWSYDHSGTTLADGGYAVTATATDAAGNEGPASEALDIVVDTTAPSAPIVDLVAASDLGISSTDNLTSDISPIIEGTAEANATVSVFVDDSQVGQATADDAGNWSFTIMTDWGDGTYAITVKAEDAAGNQSTASSDLSITFDNALSISATSPADNETDVLPNANLTITFDKNVVKATGNITIKQVSDDTVLETIDVTGSNVTVSGAEVTIDPVDNILPPDTEFYVSIDEGAFENEAGAPFAGISDNSTFSFTIIAASVVSSVDVPADGTYMIGDNLDFTVNMILPVSISGTATIPLTIGSTTVNASQVGAVSNSSTVLFRYTVAEDELDADGITVGTAINLNGGTMRDEFDVDAILTLNSVASTAGVLVDAVKPTPAITSTAVDLVNGTFSATITYDEAVENFTVNDLTVVNGTAGNLANTATGTTWTVDITPTADGEVSVSLAVNTANDQAGNGSNASNTVTRDFDGTAPVVVSLNRTGNDPVNTGITELGYRLIFSEEVTGVDLSDLEVVLTGTATGSLSTVMLVDATTYDITVDGIGGQGTIGVNVKTDDSIIDAATNPLGGTFTGQVYTTNFIPTDIGLSVSAIDENNALTVVVAAISTTDADAVDSHAYTLVAGTGDTDNASFTIDGASLRANNVSFNFEDQSSYALRLMTDDGKGGTFEKAFTITVNDLNEVPSMLSLSNSSIDEDDNAQDVGMLVALDQDGGETFTYTLVSGTGDEDNAEFEISGNTLRTAGLINFEDGTTRSILVRVTDSGGLTLDQQFTINIGEVVIEPLREYETNIPGGAVHNVFSPNGDGINETWVIEDLLDNPVNEVKVYAQGGKLIYSQVNYRNDWDGTFKGEPIPDGTYYYEINVYDGQRIIKGFLTIIRNR